MPAASGYSIWLVPERHSLAYSSLSVCIDTIAQKLGTPCFDPHITLLGEVDDTESNLLSRCELLAGMLKPYEANLGAIASNGTYYQIAFACVEATAEVMYAHRQARAVFGIAPSSYFPHLSLAYGNLPLSQISSIVEQDVDALGLPKRFPLTSFELWRTEGEVQEWRFVRAFSFATRS